MPFFFRGRAHKEATEVNEKKAEIGIIECLILILNIAGNYLV
jgi:hypothetical protein